MTLSGTGLEYCVGLLSGYAVANGSTKNIKLRGVYSVGDDALMNRRKVQFSEDNNTLGQGKQICTKLNMAVI